MYSNFIEHVLPKKKKVYCKDFLKTCRGAWLAQSEGHATFFVLFVWEREQARARGSEGWEEADSLLRTPGSWTEPKADV